MKIKRLKTILLKGLKVWNKIMAKAKPKPKPLTKKTIGRACRQLQSLYKKYTKKTILLKELRAMLLYLIDNYASVIYNNNTLTVQTENIDCKYDGHLGTAVIIFKIKKALKEIKECGYFYESSLRVRDLSGNRFRHRHVFSSGSGNLCKGHARPVLHKSFQEGRLDDFIDVVQQVLRT